MVKQLLLYFAAGNQLTNFIESLLHACTHTHKKAKPTAAIQNTAIVPSKPALCTTQVLEPCAGRFSWGRASNPKENCLSLTERR